MTRRMFFPLILAVLLIFVALPAGAQMMGGGYGYGMGPGMMYGQQGQQGYYGQQGQQGYGMGPGMMYGYGAGVDPKEVREAYEMQQQYAEQTYSLRREYLEKSQRLALELSSEKPDKAKVNELAKRIKAVWGELFDASLDLGLKMSAKGLGGYGMMGYGMMGGGMMGGGMMGYGMGPGMMYGYPGYGN